VFVDFSVELELRIEQLETENVGSMKEVKKQKATMEENAGFN
jgi:hypothetical protein